MFNPKISFKSDKFLKIKHIGHQFLSNTSIPGLTCIFTSKSLKFKVVCTLFLLLSFATGLYNISDLSNSYHKYEVITNVVRLTPPNVTFPAITFCAKSLVFTKALYQNATFIRNEYNFDHILSMKNNMSMQRFIVNKSVTEADKSRC
jgi:hypothetical protein